MPRPTRLDPLFRSVRSVKGVGPQIATLMARFFDAPEGQDAPLVDVLLHMPAGAIDRRMKGGISAAIPGTVATLSLHIDEHAGPPPGNRRAPYRIFTHDETGELTITYFAGKASWLQKVLPVGENRIVSGTVTTFGGMKQISHPDHIVRTDELDTLPMVEPVYPLTHGLTNKTVHKVVVEALKQVPDLPEWIAPERLKSNHWPSFRAALEQVHNPGDPADLQPFNTARTRLAYDEYLAGQLTLLIIRSTMTRQKGTARQLTGELTGKVLDALPFSPTGSQLAAFDDIKADLTSTNRMSRLLQGDVGAGKTLVALLAMAALAEDGAQSAFMAPTELLAAQHYRTLEPLCTAAGIGIVLLTGKQDAATRKSALARLASGDASIAVGTHALFQTGVEFADLGLTIVDEQHRFGVHQRLALSDKGRHTELLVMTATPIPRTLVLTHFGDMAVSKLTEKPAGRQPIDTAVMPVAAYDRVIARLKARVDEGAQAFWVCPLVEESEEVSAMSAEERAAKLREVFGARVGLVHGRMGAQEKQAVMDGFLAGELAILVATTVIEVGVDVPNATIMIIEHAERFGLAQLHQLRGRVGRGSARSACLLLHGEPLTDLARARLDTIKSTEDGFEIAERDLELRGQGDLLGTRQSGMPGYRLALPDLHRNLLEYAHDDAQALLEQDPGLTSPRGDAVRNLLYLLRRDLAIPLIKAG
ncbi:ATP-dependent DNA helicase RecG [Cucumibacter marinus]|uniref:ATP-dependent DNA helicase RecG n=1 Tax=Cucumibacter marinus TaxID=1121252 RepID=UPI000424640E|nr:ATP-dependent DNA helicase RecG [Cucumibacter marinus]